MNIEKIHEMIEKDGIVFLTYGGTLTQTLIAAMTEALEEETKNSELSMGTSNDIFIIFIELSQNMMNYSKRRHIDEISSEGLILISKDSDENYSIISQNIIATEDKEHLEAKLSEIQQMDKEEIRKRYRELRKSGRQTHAKGGGIGFYEIAKKCDEFSYEFIKINDDRYYFQFKADVKARK